MGDYESGTAIFISVIVGFLMLFFIDGIFAYTLTGFIATYLTRIERRSAAVGSVAALILAILSFGLGMLFGPDMPSRITYALGPDVFSFSVGFIITCALGILLGGLGGYVAVKAFREY